MATLATAQLGDLVEHTLASGDVVHGILDEREEHDDGTVTITIVNARVERRP